MLIVLLNFGEFLAARCLSLNNKLCMAKPTFVDLNFVELNSFPFMINLDKCNGSCNVADELSTKICVLSKTKVVNVTVFNMITRINEAKTLIKHIHVTVNANSIVQNMIQIKNGMTMSLPNYLTCICKNSRHLKSILDNSVIVCNEIINVRDS